MIAFQNVSIGYNRRRKVIADLSLTFGEGHIHGLLGRNGTGKSTLLNSVLFLCLIFRWIILLLLWLGMLICFF